MRLGQSIRSVKVTPLDNGCAQLEVLNKGFAKDLSYVAERCPIQNGWQSKMLSSEDFERLEIIWQAVSHEAGSKVTIRVNVALKYPVPKFLIQRMVGSALGQTLERIDAILQVGTKSSP